ncbi:MAG: hypothetical protein K5986_06430 [Clostridium sp.]|nr:hypothetical protein [Clostridium sp.]
MTIVFFTVPYVGHITPNIPLFEELLKRGFKLIIFGSEEYLKKYLTGNNVVYKPYPEYIYETFKIKVDSELNSEEAAEAYYSYYYDEKLLRERAYLLFKITSRFYEDYYKKIKELNPSVIMYDFNAFFVKKIISKIKVKRVELNCNECEPMDLIKSKNWHSFINDIVLNEVEKAPSPDQIILVNKKIQRFFKKMNYEYDIDSIEKSSFAYVCPELQGEVESVDPEISYLGFDLQKSVDCNKDGSIYISRGTMSDAFGIQTLIKTVQSLENIDNKIVVSLGNNKKAQKVINDIKFRDNVEIKLFTNQIECLSKADLFITHGGITGVRESLISETPMLVIPLNFNDYQVGKALEKANAGILIEKRPLDKDEIEEKIKYMLDNIDEYRKGVTYIANNLKKYWNDNGVEYLIDQLKY